MTDQEMTDQESQRCLALLEEAEKLKKNRFHGVRTVLVVLSSSAIVFDRESLKQKVLLAYPEAAVFFKNTAGRSMGSESPEKVDLLIDFTGPSDRQSFFMARRLRSRSRHSVGRNAGWFRKGAYTRVFEESRTSTQDMLDHEREVQKEVLALAGVSLFPSGDVPQDRGKSIALELPPLARL